MAGGDPVVRLKQHLINIGEWSEENHTELEENRFRGCGSIQEAVKSVTWPMALIHQQILFSQKYTKKFHGIFKNSMMR